MWRRHGATPILNVMSFRNAMNIGNGNSGSVYMPTALMVPAGRTYGT